MMDGKSDWWAGYGHDRGDEARGGIPNYTDNPKEKGYYGRVKANDASNLKTDGGNAWNQTDSVMKNPKEPISHDAPFIQAGKDIADKADSIVGKTGPDCKAEQMTRSTFTRHVRERDLGGLRTSTNPPSGGGVKVTAFAAPLPRRSVASSIPVSCI